MLCFCCFHREFDAHTAWRRFVIASQQSPQTGQATRRTTSPPSPRPCLKLCPAQSLGVNSLSSYSQRQAEAWAPVVATAVEVVMVVAVML